MHFHLTNKATPKLTETLMSWLQAEWGRIDDFNVPRLPAPIFATTDEGGLAGGLVFTRAERPDDKADVLWINAVFVAEKYRGHGLATQLIKAAEIEAWKAGEAALFALTDVPALYRRQGWEQTSVHEDSVIMALERPYPNSHHAYIAIHDYQHGAVLLRVFADRLEDVSALLPEPSWQVYLESDPNRPVLKQELQLDTSSVERPSTLLRQLSDRS